MKSDLDLLLYGRRRQNTRGRISSGPTDGFSEEAAQFFERLATPPSDARAALYATLIDALVTEGVWAKLDGLYAFAGADEATSLVSLVGATYNAQRFITSGGPAVFTADRGFLGAAGINGVTTTFNPSSDPGHYVRDDAMLCGWCLTATQLNKAFMGADESGNIELFQRWSDNKSYFGINSASEDNQAHVADSTGLWLLNRTSSSAIGLYRSDATIGTKTKTSAVPTNANINYYGQYTVAFGALGSSLSAGERTALYSAAAAYLTAVGAI